MKKVCCFVVVVAVLIFGLQGSVPAALIQTITHDYGNTAGKVAPTGGESTYVILDADWVNVGVPNDVYQSLFSDDFDFDATGYDVTDFELKLWYIESKDNTEWGGTFWFYNEEWWVQPASSSNFKDGSHELQSIGVATQFFYDDSLDTFAAMVDEGKFQLGFWDEKTGHANTFKLSKATLNVNGDPVPIPGALWLLFSGLLGLVVVRRRKR